MARTRKRISKKAGLAPGSLIHIGEQKEEQVRITLIDYDSDHCEQKSIAQIRKAAPLKDTTSVTWINIDGLHDVKVIEEIGKHFDLHSLTLEDVLHTNQRPKMEPHEHYIYVVLRMLRFDTENQKILSEQVSMILAEHYVLTFQESIGDVFDPIRERIREPNSRLRKHGPDYLLYRLLDSIVDQYFVVLEKVGDQIELLQEQVSEDPDEKTLQQIHSMRREMINLRRTIWPVRDLISSFQRMETPLIQEKIDVFLNDLYDHIVRVIDTVESYREMISSLLDLYMSGISNKMNAVMKVLTIIATIFIPLTFIAGIYGMNFEYMPELKYPWAYPLVWLIMAAVTLGMLFYFKRKKWL
jgi:magnesium transporter